MRAEQIARLVRERDEARAERDELARALATAVLKLDQVADAAKVGNDYFVALCVRTTRHADAEADPLRDAWEIFETGAS